MLTILLPADNLQPFFMMCLSFGKKVRALHLSTYIDQVLKRTKVEMIGPGKV